MGEKKSSWKRYGVVLLVGALGGWYFSPRISNYFSQIEERTRVIKTGVESVLGIENEPEPVKEKDDGSVAGIYERFCGKKGSVDDKVQEE